MLIAPYTDKPLHLQIEFKGKQWKTFVLWLYVFFLSLLFTEKYKPLPNVEALSQFHLFCFTSVILKEYYVKSMN